MNRGDGGPAFPANTLNVPFAQAGSPEYEGMSLRDYFAGQALSGKTMALFVQLPAPHGMKRSQRIKEIVIAAYEIADAMLEAGK